ncbi:unnamed protein product [Oppiella nova]|uniref:Uncharacterized protein n=1 Tax=Oppiella nova TaxID=334625 RepID=A0A7R9ML64_9ACAR|nr:unnamed protein product [Oppiella nova]CAG2179319.1 unnamed protein product [Oppiella nova]
MKVIVILCVILMLWSVSDSAGIKSDDTANVVPDGDMGVNEVQEDQACGNGGNGNGGGGTGTGGGDGTANSPGRRGGRGR